jgi:thymidylate synthase (FAD)
VVEELEAGLPADERGTDRERRRAIRAAARSILPEATETSIVVTANARALRHFLDERGSIAGDEEMRTVSAQLLEFLRHDAPATFADFESSVAADGLPQVRRVPLSG